MTFAKGIELIQARKKIIELENEILTLKCILDSHNQFISIFKDNQDNNRAKTKKKERFFLFGTKKKKSDFENHNK